MTLLRWLRSALAPRPASRTRPPARRLAVELLEDRLTPSTGGSLDPTFGSGGHVLSSFSNAVSTAYAVTTQPDGKVVIAGTSFTSGSKTGNDFLVARYNADGSVDTSFGTGGGTLTDFGSSADRAYAVALQPQTNGSSKILVAGYDGGGTFAVARYNADGTLDTTFGGKTYKGKVTTALGGSSSVADSMVVDSAGRILVAGTTNVTGAGTVAALVRYTADGALDTTFGSGGKLLTNIPLTSSQKDAIALQADGKIVLASTTTDPATSRPEFLLARFNANGTADSGFGTGGVVKTHVGVGDGFGGLTIQGDGRIVIDGSESTGYVPPALYMLRYNTDGTLDPGFGTGGVASLSGPSAFLPCGVAVQTDGCSVEYLGG